MADEVLNLDTTKLIEDYKKIENAIVDDSSIFAKTLKYLEDSFNDKTLAPKDKISIQANLMSAMTINLTARALDTALNMQQVRSQIDLSNAEIDFNKARTKLVDAQTETEKEKKNAVIREVTSYDDQLNIKEAEIITNAVFGYASGGVSVPSDLMTKMLNAIDKITPNS
ncbi:hypothetical protein CDQ71_00310 [Campylobacter hyointestinalis subsp. hyointestinalis]|uniref:hypothetical protein n=1 Tax=Campylobacter hyointestinalis TaxID=198 RepID=UPI000CE4D662|nr:hypothetical protein [Campylobacter hyointestinalis]PPB58774.1 hypothetical protein CDQ71_00310 [Campylobacter hyointestinalis subsp. hyointestinalis]TWO19274.1 hypothetical protein YZ80_07800 [Campylobacter hyointestinalis]